LEEPTDVMLLFVRLTLLAPSMTVPFAPAFVMLLSVRLTPFAMTSMPFPPAFVIVLFIPT